MSDVIVGLDIGTSNVRVVVAEFTEENKLEVIGLGTSPSTGLRKGAVLNIEATVRAITDAVEEAEKMAGHEIKNCCVAIGGSQIDGFNSKGQVAVTVKGRDSTGDNKEIDQNDINRVIEAARNIKIPPDRCILHVIPQSYTVDGQETDSSPKAMLGCRLEVEVHIITASVTAMENIKRCVFRSGYEVSGIMLKTLAAARSVMTEEERKLGSILIDLGGGTTDVLIIQKDAPVCSCSVPLGGQNVTKDIAAVKGITESTAEQLKIQSGCCWAPLIDSDEYITLPSVGGRPPEEISRQELCQIIEPRVMEILMMARDKLAMHSRSHQLAGSVVLCGGGALMPGVQDLAQHVFQTNAVRIGKSADLSRVFNRNSSGYANPAENTGLFKELSAMNQPVTTSSFYDEYNSSEFATATGIVLLCADDYRKQIEEGKYQVRSAPKSSELGQKFLSFLKEFF